jgi:hypothetical protein
MKTYTRRGCVRKTDREHRFVAKPGPDTAGFVTAPGRRARRRSGRRAPPPRVYPCSRLLGKSPGPRVGDEVLPALLIPVEDHPHSVVLIWIPKRRSHPLTRAALASQRPWLRRSSTSERNPRPSPLPGPTVSSFAESVVPLQFAEYHAQLCPVELPHAEDRASDAAARPAPIRVHRRTDGMATRRHAAVIHCGSWSGFVAVT